MPPSWLGQNSSVNSCCETWQLSSAHPHSRHCSGSLSLTACAQPALSHGWPLGTAHSASSQTHTPELSNTLRGSTYLFSSLVNNPRQKAGISMAHLMFPFSRECLKSCPNPENSCLIFCRVLLLSWGERAVKYQALCLARNTFPLYAFLSFLVSYIHCFVIDLLLCLRLMPVLFYFGYYSVCVCYCFQVACFINFTTFIA